MFKVVRSKPSFLFPFLCIAVLLFFGCKKSVNDKVDFGTFTNSVYQNHYFGLTASFPADWSFQDQKEQTQIMKDAAQTLWGKDTLVVIKVSDLSTLHLFVVFEYPRGASVPFNSSITCVAESVKHEPGVKRGNDYLDRVKNIQSQGLEKFIYPTNNYSAKLGGVDFDVMETRLNVNGYIVRQKDYAAIMKGYAISFITSSATPNQEASLQKILDSIKFQ